MQNRRLHAWLAPLALVAGLAAATPVAAQPVARSAVEGWIDGALAEIRRAGADSATRGAVTTDASGGFAVADVAVTFPGAQPLRLSVGRIAGEGVATSQRFQARALRFETVSGGNAVLTVSAPAIAFEGLDMAPMLPTAFAGGMGSGLATALRELTLSRMSVPEVQFRYADGTVTATAATRGVSADGISRGVAGRLVTGATTITVAERDNAANGTGQIGASEVRDFDLALNAQFFSTNPNVDRTPRLVYSSGRVEPSSFQIGGQTPVRIGVGQLDIRNARMTPPRLGYFELLALVERVQAGEASGQADAEASRALAAAMPDWLEAGTVESMALGTTTLETPEGTFRLGRIEASGLGSAQLGRLSFEGLDFRSPEANASLGALAITDLDFKAMLLAVFAEMAAGRDMPNPAALEGKLPRIGGIEVRALTIEQPGQAPISLQNAAYGMGRWIGFVPELLRLSVAQLNVPSSLIEATGTVSSPTPSELGYAGLNFSSDIQLRVDERARTLTLSPGQVSLADIGGLSLDVTLGDVDSTQFGLAGLADPQALLQQTTFRQLRFRLDNAGFLERYSTWAARRQNRSAEQLRNEIAQGMTPFVDLVISDPAAKERARQAVQAFARNPRSFTVTVGPRNRLTLGEIVQMTSGGGPPFALLGRLDVRISAND